MVQGNGSQVRGAGQSGGAGEPGDAARLQGEQLHRGEGLPTVPDQDAPGAK
jgi:hypothetical protein